MHVLIPAAGYGTRLYPLTKNIPKALLKIDNKPIFEHIIAKVKELPKVKKITVISNDFFYEKFSEWLSGFEDNKNIQIINDGTRNEKERLGSIGDINLAIEKFKIKEDVLVVNSDNVFEFSLQESLNYFNEKKAPIICLFDVKSKDLAKLYGVIKIDKNNRITDFKEKPEKPESTLISTGIYYFPKNTVPFFNQYLAEDKSSDKSGYFVEWLYKKVPTYGYLYKKEAWFDIGSLESLKEAQNCFLRKREEHEN
ncbi:MAG: nucleoside-diphosphate-sugar pyrophosphorylase [Candidatus Diapherotrites archaeon CG08_land_8_20_14_0_20_34_12]|nr:MAG: nucleoside-diphosphate-sugar pyrophosphorylase [Candidatus Diapherotrites archaeon CG08_land_8_20_14_0_20_34_12]